MENWGGSLYGLPNGAFPTFVKADLTLPQVGTADIGAAAASALLEGGHGKTVIELSGPRDYSPKDVGAALARVAGKAIVVQEGPEEAIVPALMGAGMNAHWAGLFAEMIHGINTGRVAWEGGSARGSRGSTEIDVVLKRLISK
jgi:NAD(P)H dehydrogenase (quinone)